MLNVIERHQSPLTLYDLKKQIVNYLDYYTRGIAARLALLYHSFIKTSLTFIRNKNIRDMISLLVKGIKK